MPFQFLNIKGFIGSGAFWITIGGQGLFVKDTKIARLTVKEYGCGGKFLGSVFFRTINQNEKSIF